MLYDDYLTQLQLLKNSGISLFDGEALCPICLRPTQRDLFTQEHAPQRSLGGRIIAITCQHCNNEAGHQIDSHLFHYLSASIPLFETPRDSGCSIRFVNPQTGKIVKGSFQPIDDKTGKLIIPQKTPSAVFQRTDLNPNMVISIQRNASFDINRIELSNVVAAIFKNAYLILFSYFGYSFLLHSQYDKLREVIAFPQNADCPKVVITLPASTILPDGVYVCERIDLKVFFVSFSWHIQGYSGNRFLVFIPAICQTWETAEVRLKGFSGKQIALHKVTRDDSFFWKNVDGIRAVVRWSMIPDLKWLFLDLYRQRLPL